MIDKILYFDSNISQKSKFIEKNEEKINKPTYSLFKNKWKLENLNLKKLELPKIHTKSNHSIYIFNCKNCLINISNKVHHISIDNCENIKLNFQFSNKWN